MAGTPKSEADLLTEFAPGQAPGSITPEDEQDFIVSVPEWDDPSNASGLGAPAILRGTVSAHLASGVTVGAGQSTATQQATLAGLQAAVNYAAQNNKFFEIVPGTYEIYGVSGLAIPYSPNMDWRGSAKTIISQFATNAPILTIGDGAGTNQAYDIYFDGVSCQYGVDQTGQTAAIGIVIGPLAFGRLKNISFGASVTGHNAYTGVAVVGSGSFFSNRVADMTVDGVQQTLLRVDNLSTGNLWERIHVHQGSHTPVAINGPAVQLKGINYSAGNGSVFEQMNIEHCLCQNQLDLEGMRGVTFAALHLEDNASTVYPTIIYMTDSSPQFIGLDILDHKFLAANNIQSPPNVFHGFYADPVSLQGFMMQWVDGGQIDTAFYVFSESGTGVDAAAVANGSSLHFADYGNNNLNSYINLDEQLTGPVLPITSGSVDRYSRSPFFSIAEGVHLYLTGNFTLYGQLRGQTYINYPASLSANATLALKNTMRSGSPGASVTRQVGDTVFVRRAAGTAANTLTITNDAGTTIATITTAATTVTCVYNGTDWVVVT